MLGIIDFVGNKKLSGWLATTVDEISVVNNGRTIDAKLAIICRSDLRSDSSKKGFELSFLEDITIEDLIQKKIVIIAKTSKSSEEIQLFHIIELTHKINNLSSRDSNLILNKLAQNKTNEIFTSTETGRISPDKASITGLNGHFFLYKGNNNVYDLYQAPLNENLVKNWINLINSRENFSSLHGALFLQILIPEKSSLLPELSCLNISGPTKNFSAFTENFINSKWFIDCNHLFNSTTCPEYIFRKNDSHLSSHGCYVIIKEIIKKINYCDIFRIRKGDAKFIQRKGDLAGRYNESNIKDNEYIEVFENIYINNNTSTPTCISRYVPEKSHIGTTVVWKNENAPINAKVVCFGNSFFERGGSSTCLTWWAARCFTEFHFVWSPSLDLAYLNNKKFDIILCQTIERFLGKVPDF